MIQKGDNPMKRLFVLLMAIFCIAGCGKKETPPNAAGQEVLLNPSMPENDEAISNVAEFFGKKSFKPLARYCWHEKGLPKFMMLFARPGNGSHASGAEISGLFAEYDGESKKWKIKARSLSFTENGTWGEAPEPRFVKLGPDRYGFTMEPGFMGQGYTKQALFVYGVTENRFVELLKIPSYADNAGAVYNDADIYTVKVDLYQVIDDRKVYYDLKAKVEISRKYAITPDDEFYETFGKTRDAVFVFRNGRYVVMLKAVRPPSAGRKSAIR
jgi:predicted small lipoprotein YifL